MSEKVLMLPYVKKYVKVGDGFLINFPAIIRNQVRTGLYTCDYDGKQVLKYKYYCELDDKEAEVDYTYHEQKALVRILPRGVLLPKDLRRHKVNLGDHVDIVFDTLESFTITLIDIQPPCCVICGKEKELNDYLDVKICRSCISGIIDTFTGI